MSNGELKLMDILTNKKTFPLDGVFKRAFQPMPGGQMPQQGQDPMMMGGGGPPGGAPPMDPSMMGGGGAPPGGAPMGPPPGGMMPPGGGGGQQVDPQTGLPVDPQTGLLMDPQSGMLIDPATGTMIDPNTGQPVDMGGGAPGGAVPAPGLADLSIEDLKSLIKDTIIEVLTGQGEGRKEEQGDKKSTELGEINEKLDTLIQMLGAGPGSAMEMPMAPPELGGPQGGPENSPMGILGGPMQAPGGIVAQASQRCSNHQLADMILNRLHGIK